MGPADEITPGAEELGSHSAAMRRLARRLLYDTSRADDVVQQAWIAALTQARPRGVSLRQWLAGVVRNLARQSGREERRRRERERAAARPEVQGSFTSAVDRIEVMRRLVEAVDGLPEPYRETVAMRFFEDLAPRAIAKRRGVPVDTVHTHLRRGLERLRARLDPGDARARDTFLSALAPLAGPLPLALKIGGAVGAASGTSKLGALTMGTKSAVGLAGVLALAVTFAVLRGGGGEPETPGPRAAAPAVAAEPRAPSQPEPAAAAPGTVGQDERAAAAPQVASTGNGWTVTGTTRSALRDAPVQAQLNVEVFEGEDETGALLAVGEATSDPSGAFAWSHAAPAGVVTVRVRPAAEGYQGFPQTRRAEAGEPPAPFQFKLFPLDVTVSGRVVSADTGLPVAGARVWSHKDEATTDAEGLYRFETTSHRSLHFLYARARGTTHARAVVGELAPDGAVTIDFELAPEVRLTGRVTDALGNALAGARVTTFYSYENEALTDARGRFDLGHLDPGRPEHMVTARLQGYVPTTLTVPTLGRTEIEQDLVLRRGARVEGLVVDERGAALPDVALYIGFSPNAFDRIDATSGADGRFVFETVARGEQTLVAQLDGHAPLRTVFQVAEDVDALPPLTLVLPVGHFVAGRVVDGAGEPVQGVWISVRHHGEYTDARTETDEDGAFRVEDLPAEAVGLELYGTGIVRLEHELAEVDRDDLALVVQRSAKIAGLVLDGRTDTPLENFRIRFAKPELQPGDVRIDGYSATWIREGHAFSNTGGLWDTGRENLAPGVVTGIEASAPGFAATVAKRAVASPDPDPERLVIRLFPGARVEGTIVAAGSSDPVAGALVKLFGRDNPLRASDSDDTHGRRLAQTDATGRFELRDVPVGEHSLFVEHPDWAIAIDGPFEVAAGAALSPRWIELGRGARVAGRAEAADGSPLAGATVQLAARSGPAAGGNAQEREVATDERGAFAFEHVPPGDYWVRHVLKGGVYEVHATSLAVAVADDGPTEVVLRPPGTATVLGSLSFDGDLPEFVEVRLLAADASGAPVDEYDRSATNTLATFAERGSFRIEGVPAGSYVVRAQHFSWTSGTRYRGAGAVQVADGATADVTVSVTAEAQR